MKEAITSLNSWISSSVKVSFLYYKLRESKENGYPRKHFCKQEVTFDHPMQFFPFVYMMEGNKHGLSDYVFMFSGLLNPSDTKREVPATWKGWKSPCQFMVKEIRACPIPLLGHREYFLSQKQEASSAGSCSPLSPPRCVTNQLHGNFHK